MAEKKKYNSILVSGRKDKTLTYSKYVKDEESGESVKESLDKKVNVTDELETQQIKDGAITNEKMAADSVGNTNLQDGSVSNEKLENESITNDKLAENSITKDKLKDNTIGVEKLDPELRQAINAATGLPENLVETIQNVDDTLKDHQSQLDDKQSQIDDNQQQITANDEDISLLQTRSTQMEETIKGIAATGGASQATAVTYDNENSKLAAINIQSAVDEVVDKTALKDEEGTLVETPFRYIQNEEFIFAKVDAADKLLFGIQWDGTPKFGKTSAVEDRLQSQVTLLGERVATIMGDEDTTNVIDTMNELKRFFAEIENTETLTDILANLNKTTIKDEEGNVQDTPFRVIENEEFIKAVVDSEDKVLFGFYRATGKPYFPLNDMYHISQNEEFLWVILDAANHPLLGIKQDGTCWAAKAQWLDDIKAIKEALSSIDENLKTFQPKEDGKGLINLDVADSFFYISNDEYIIAVVDAESRILAGIKYDGEPYFPNHEMYSVITNEEWLYAIIDAEDKILGGFRVDDGHMIVGGIDISTFISNAIIDIADIKERTAHLSTIENDEYLSVETDTDGKVIGYTTSDGSHYLYKVKSETIPTEFGHIEDIENRIELITDADGKVLSYRDKEGRLNEKKEIVFSKEGLTNFAKSLKGAGIDIIDWSNNDFVEIPKPTTCILINITTPKQAETKGDNIECFMEFWDKNGNYFKKPIILNAQGSSSMGYNIKNQSVEVTDGSKIKIGEWLPMDSFHIKKYFIDCFRGQCIVGYWLGEQIYQTRNPLARRPWDYLRKEADYLKGSDGDFSNDFIDGALGHPDGFACKVFFNGRNCGIYAFNLKKDRNNYHCNKKVQNNIILDGILGETFFTANGDLTKEGLNGASHIWDNFEIRNPKISVDINGNKYDGDNPKEPSENYKEAKDYIRNLTKAIPSIISASTDDEKKRIFESVFNLDFLIDYDLHGQVLYNYDGYEKNWIWCCWDGKLWTPTFYDLDSIFGSYVQGLYCVDGTNTILGEKEVPTKYLHLLYKDRMCKRYKELRDAKIFDVNNIINLLTKWLSQCGYSNLKEDITEIITTDAVDNEGQVHKNVPYTPSYRNGKWTYPEYPTTSGWFNSVSRVEKWLEKRLEYLDEYFNYSV